MAGRNFSREFSTDPENAYILNETAVKALGWTTENAIGKQFYLYGGRPATVIGVIQDFHMHSMRMQIEPLMLELRNTFFNHIAVKVQAEELDETISYISTEMEDPFLISPSITSSWMNVSTNCITQIRD